jgi:hypothetical protein
MLQRIDSMGIIATLRRLSQFLWTSLVTLYMRLLTSGEAESGENHSTYARCFGDATEAEEPNN